MLDLADAEHIAAEELRLAEMDGHDEPPFDLLLHRRGILLAEYGSDSPIRGIGTHGRLKGRPVVYVHECLDRRARAFVALHEMAHTIVEDRRLDLACSLERWCNRFAASILCPGPTVRRTWRDTRGDLLAALAMRPAVTGSTFALRVGEVDIAPVVVFDRSRARYAEPDIANPDAIRKLAATARKEAFAEDDVARAWRLPDATHRVAVVFKAAA